MIKKALIVGINDYSGSAECLNGSVKDAEDLAELLGSTYSEEADVQRQELEAGSDHKEETNFACTVLTSDNDSTTPRITRAKLKKEIKALFEDEEADVVLFYFSGHGFENSLGGYLVPQDAKTYADGISFNDLVTHANRALDKEIFIILDCCRSGNLGDMVISKNQFSNIRQGVSIMTASNARQLSFDTEGGGVFTQLVCNALRGGSADILGNVTFFNLYRHADSMLGVWEQRPTFKVNIKQSIVLRKVEPKIHPSILSKIVDYFPTDQSEFQLDPSFEPTENLGKKDKERQFSELQTLANNGIVVPVDEEHMYYGAVRSKSCKLTLLGRQYFRLLKEDGKLC